MSRNLKIISFLGFTYYQNTTYLHPDYLNNKLKYHTRFIQEALIEFYQPDTLYVLLTKKVENCFPTKRQQDKISKASKTNWEKLQTKLVNKVNITPIRDIPETGNPEHIWEIFNQITSCLHKGDRVIFDITNGFRSFPIIALLAICYLKVVREIEIEGLVYGAFEAKNQEKNETPTYDLLPIISLLDWITATDKFLKTGNGQELSTLLNQADNSNINNQNLARNINNIAQGLHLLRPMYVMEEAIKLPINIKNIAPTVSQEIQPFATLLQRIEDDYGKYALQTPTNFKSNGKETLKKMLEMAEWYREKEQYIQSLSLAREWLPSLLCWHFELNVLDKSNRYEMETILNYGKPKGELQEQKYLAKWMLISPSIQQSLRSLWNGTRETNLANIRNDIAHSGFRPNPRTIEEIVEQTELVIDELKKIADSWGI